MRGKIKDGNIVVYKSDYSRSFIKDKELYDLYKGIPYVVKEENLKKSKDKEKERNKEFSSLKT